MFHRRTWKVLKVPLIRQTVGFVSVAEAHEVGGVRYKVIRCCRRKADDLRSKASDVPHNLLLVYCVPVFFYTFQSIM